MKDYNGFSVQHGDLCVTAISGTEITVGAYQCGTNRDRIMGLRYYTEPTWRRKKYKSRGRVVQQTRSKTPTPIFDITGHRLRYDQIIAFPYFTSNFSSFRLYVGPVGTRNPLGDFTTTREAKVAIRDEVHMLVLDDDLKQRLLKYRLLS